MIRQETWVPVYNELVAGHYKTDKDYGSWRSRGTMDWLLILTKGGGGRFGTSSGDLVTSTGDVVLIQPGTPHDYGTASGSTNWDLMWVHFHPRDEWLCLLDWPNYAKGTVSLHIDEPKTFKKLTDRFQEMITCSVGTLTHREAFCMNALEELLLWLDLENPKTSRHTIDSRVRDAMDFMCAHLDETLSVGYLSNEFNLSVSRFSHLFRQEIGESPQLFHERKKLERSAQLLSVTDRSVSSIANEVGYTDPLYFSARFKKRFGISPTLYRTQHQASISQK